MTTVTRVTWNPAALNAAIASAFSASIQAAAQDAEAHSPTPRAGAKATQTSSGQAGLEPTGDLGAIMEKGTRPHVIAPDPGKVLFMKGINVFSAGPVDHPGTKPQPYLGPAAFRWARGGFHAIARAILMGAGFR